MKRILLTGAAGIVGSALRPLLRELYDEVLLTDLNPIEDPAGNERFEAGDISDFSFVSPLASQVEGIVHLAGKVGPDYTFDEVLGPNLIGSYHVFEAARQNGISHVVYASSHHAVGYRKRTDAIDEHTAPRPDSFYGLSKAFGEEIGSLYADRHGINVLAIRIGYVGETVIDERRLHTWISARDLAQLIGIGLSTPDLGFQIVYGVSDNPEPFFDNANAVRLGYRPQDRSVDHLADPSLLDAHPDPDSPEGIFVGGHFCQS
jgi:uronate dehydrogenase